MNKDDHVWIAGHTGLVGSALVRALKNEGYVNIVQRGHDRLDLREQADVRQFFKETRIDYIIVAAARVGGIKANATQPTAFLRDNLLIATNVISAAHDAGVKKLLFLGSSCIYPKHAPQPLREEMLLTGPLEPTNEAYAIAKIAGVKLCEFYTREHHARFISAMPTNLYGPGDNFHPEHSHVVPGLLRRFHEARVQGAAEVHIWGTGTARREFLHVDDLVAALLLLMRDYEAPELINVGCGEDLTILELATMIKETVGFRGSILTDPTMPDGTPQKRLDITRIQSLGWRPMISLRDGLEKTYRWARETGALAG